MASCLNYEINIVFPWERKYSILVQKSSFKSLVGYFAKMSEFDYLVLSELFLLSHSLLLFVILLHKNMNIHAVLF